MGQKWGCRQHSATWFHTKIKPWPNGAASRRKVKTWVYLRLRLASSYVHLRWLVMTCAHHVCSRSNLRASGHATQVNESWVTSINLLLANEIQDMYALKCVFLQLAYICEETCWSVWPPNTSLYASSTCRSLRLFAKPLGQGLRDKWSCCCCCCCSVSVSVCLIAVFPHLTYYQTVWHFCKHSDRHPKLISM